MAPSKHHHLLRSFALLPGRRSHGDLVHLHNRHHVCVRRARVFQRLAFGGIEPRSLAAINRGLKAGGCQRGISSPSEASSGRSVTIMVSSHRPFLLRK